MSEWPRVRRALGGQCACGRAPDPGLHHAGGCMCKDQDGKAEERRRDRNRRTGKPALFFVAGQWWALCFGREDDWNIAALAWTVERNVCVHGIGQ